MAEEFEKKEKNSPSSHLEFDRRPIILILAVSVVPLTWVIMHESYSQSQGGSGRAWGAFGFFAIVRDTCYAMTLSLILAKCSELRREKCGGWRVLIYVIYGVPVLLFGMSFIGAIWHLFSK